MISLSEQIPASYALAHDKDSLFSDDRSKGVLKNRYEPRELPQYGKPGDSCKYNLFFGFFFDGTRNNYMACEPSAAQAADTKRKEDKERKSPNCHSNVARLYDVCPGCRPRHEGTNVNATRRGNSFANA